MKKILLVMVLSMTLQARIPDDKIQHMSAGFLIYVGCLVVTDVLQRNKYNPLICLVPVTVAGVGKEIYDKHHPENHTAEIMDAVATMAIPIAGSIVLYRW